MEIYKLKIIDGISIGIPSMSAFVKEKIFKKNNLKFEESNSGKSIIIPEQTILFKDKQIMYNVAHNLIECSDELIMQYDNGTLNIESIHIVKLIIEHDIILDVYTELEESEITELTEYFKSISVFHSFDENNICKISAQKCNLEFKYIDKIIQLITYGSNPEASLEMYDESRYTITQKQGYHKYLK